MVRYEGEYGFDTFLEQGGAASDTDVAAYITSLLAQEIHMEGTPFGCSTLSVENQDGGYLFGRNFDWNACNGLIVSARSENSYASVSTVNMDFIRAGGIDISKLPDSVRAIVSLYAPLDGMNEKGLAVSVNMIQDSVSVNQDTAKPDLTTTTAVRLLLDKAANVEEALEHLQQYDFHSSMGMMVHLALADAEGRSVAVEYVDNEMIVIETPVVTNFYLADGEKQGIGTAQSHTRYEILTQMLEERGAMTETEVRDALDSVSKDNFGEFESTEWSIVMNQETKELIYYHRENYETAYAVSVE
ncbi:MAG: linear amide C-N hydrolase [Lachnospiraceae bacterium]|nr:linear amide C-N hydrolase [Lachnospiraceae bacterium]